MKKYYAQHCQYGTSVKGGEKIYFFYSKKERDNFIESDSAYNEKLTRKEVGNSEQYYYKDKE